MRLIYFIILSMLLLIPAISKADSAQDIYVFPTVQQQQQFNLLTQQLRCLVCQNETLADSNAPLAKDLRNDIAQMIKQGQTDQEITAYLRDRYGDFVLYQPPLSTNTIILWFAPGILLLIGLFCTARIIWQRQKLARINKS